MLLSDTKRLKVIPRDHPFYGKKMWVPAMSYGGAKLFAGAFRSIGIDADSTPRSDERTRELGAQQNCGDECSPTKTTRGDTLRIHEHPDTDVSRTIFFLPTSGGPCRFG